MKRSSKRRRGREEEVEVRNTTKSKKCKEILTTCSGGQCGSQRQPYARFYKEFEHSDSEIITQEV